MPLVGGDVDKGAARDHVNRSRLGSRIVVKVLHEMPPQADHCLRGRPVPMNGKNRSRLDGVEHSLGLVRRRIPEIQVHPETR